MSLPKSPSESTAVYDLLGAIAQPVYIKNTKHQWLYVNEAGATLIGLSAEEVVGRSKTVDLPEPLTQQLRQQDEAFFETQQNATAPLIFAETNTDGDSGPGEERQFIGHRKLIELEGQCVLVNTLQDVTELLHTRQRNEALNETLQAKSTKLTTALRLESTLKLITDRVRDSLEVQQILQTAVDELVEVLKVKAANTALYDLKQGTSTVYYECSAGLAPMRGRVSQMEAYSEVYDQLLARQYLQFCSIFPNPERGRVSMFAAPIMLDEDDGVIGDLWLISDVDASLDELNIRLVQQVTNQCAIAIRQARLYQESQSQVRELERLNTLKDDFLSTVSHELRTPVTSMRLSITLLGDTLNQAHDLECELEKPHLEQSRLARYYRILREECEREITLINDLLDLQRLDAGNHPMEVQPINLSNWLPNLINGFRPRAKSRGQTLTLTIPQELPELISDLASLERVLAELTNNACKYTPPDHSIHIAVACSPHHPISPHSHSQSIQYSAENCQRGTMQISVINTGIEIAAAERHRIFDKFYRVPSADRWQQGGTGLGLALVQRLLIHLEGRITVESDHNQTAFVVELPLEPTVLQQL